MTTTPSVDPARWLRGATSAGDPTAWAVKEVLDELERLRAIEQRARDLIGDDAIANSTMLARHILGES